MDYSKRKALASCLLFLAVFLCMQVRTVSASGGVIITEIMYDASGSDTDHEWIEIHNTTNASIDLTKYRYNDGVSSSNHVFNNPPAFPAGAYALLVDNPTNFQTANPSISGVTLIDTVLSSLNNTGGTLTIMDCSANPCSAADTVTYASSQGASGDGNSLQRKTDGSWISAAPTPGMATVETDVATSSESSASTSDTTQSTDTSDEAADANTASTTDSSATATGDTSADVSAESDQTVTNTAESTGSFTTTIASAPSKNSNIQASLTLPQNAIVGIPITISPTVLGYQNEVLFYGAFHCAFGDGSVYDGTNGNVFSHTYQFPGTYVVLFEYRSNYYQPKPDTTVRAVLTVTSSPIVISNIDADGTVSLTNKGIRDADLSQWIIKQSGNAAAGTFVIPNGTIIFHGTTISFSPSVTGFVPMANALPILMLPSGAVSVAFTPAVVPVDVPEAREVISPPKENTYSLSSAPAPLQKTKSTTLTASVVQALPPVSTVPTPISSGNHLVVPIVFALLASSAGAVFAIRRFRALKKEKGNQVPPELSVDAENSIDSIRIVEE